VSESSPVEEVTLPCVETREEALALVAAHCGIEPGYIDIWGRQHATTPETQEAILRALGVPCATRQSLIEALEQDLWREWSRPLSPTLVISQRLGSIRVRLDSAHLGGEARFEITTEEGRRIEAVCRPETFPVRRKANLRSRVFVEIELPLPSLPLGYHRLNWQDASGSTASARLAVCPDRAWQPAQLAAHRKVAGLGIALYGMRSHRNWGAGDFTDLEQFLAWAVHHVEASFVALNPLHAIANRSPYNTSPYLPACSLYRNFLYLDVERVPEFTSSVAAQRLFASPSVRALLEELRATEYVDYERVSRIKLVFLRIAFREFRRKARGGSPRNSEFEAFRQREGTLLRRWATYCALDEWIHRRHPNVWIWTDWPESYRNPDSPETAAFVERHANLVLFYEWLQWLIDQQLAAAQSYAMRLGMTIGLYHDLALATDQYGADLWGFRDFYLPGCRVGSPPDDFSPSGQDWSFPPPNIRRHQEDGYRFFTETIRKNARHGGALRIDHVMRFFRLYWIPAQAAAKDGAYVRDRAEDLLHLLALESVRGQFLVVGEDLGTVPPELRGLLERFGIFSYRLFYFERDGERFRAPVEYPWQALVSSTTHDLPTLAGFWTARDVETRCAAGITDERSYREQLDRRAREKQSMLDALHAAGLLPDWVSRNAADLPELTGELHNAVIGFLASTGSALLLINQEDLTKETEQQNLPGSTWQYPNWKRKMRYTLGELESVPEVRDCAAMVKGWIERSGRTG
jgi:4-alpha-glucanotransferase